MAIRFPLQGVLDRTITGNFGPNSVAGGVAIPFTIPQDTDNVLVKFTASTVGGGVSATLQTTDDGGNTWYDVARTSVVSNTGGEQNAAWAAGTVINPGQATGFTQSASVLTVGIGNSAASTLGAQQVSGLPVMSQQARVFLIASGNPNNAANTVRARVYVNSQSATA